MEFGQAVNTQHDEIQKRLDQKAGRKNIFRRMVPFAGLLFVFLFFLIVTNGALIKSDNLRNIINQCFTVTVVVIGATFVYSMGMFDISIGAVMAVSQLVIAFAIKAGGIPVPVLILIGIVVAVGITAITSIVTSVLKVPTFIATFCLMYLCNGIVITVTTKQKMIIPLAEYNYLNNPAIKAIALAIVLVIGFTIYYKTRLGRDVKAMGGNEIAAVQSGIKKVKTYTLAFACLGVCVGVAAFFSLMRTSQVTASSGSGLGLNILVAFVLGGFPLTGGANSRMLNAIVGALTIILLQNGLMIISMDSQFNLFLQAIMLIVVVAISYDRSKGRFVK